MRLCTWITLVLAVYPAHAMGGVVDERIADVPAELDEAVTDDPEQRLPELVAFLVADARDEAHSVKLIHDWIATHIAYDLPGLMSGDGGGGGYGETLRTGKAVCDGYARLFERMCRLAGIEARVVSGYARGLGFGVLGSEPLEEGAHSWNVTRIDGEWRLVDTTWDAGRVIDGEWVRRYSIDYLFPSPGAFVHSHLPADPQWQLLDEPLTVEQFHDLPDLKGEFFSFGLELTDDLPRISQAEDETSIQVQVPQGVQLIPHLETAQGEVIEGRTFVDWGDQDVTIEVAFPETGEYVVGLYARHPGDATYMEVASLGFRAEVEEARGTFPLTYSEFTERRCDLIQPRQLPPKTRRITFAIRVPDAEAVSVILGTEARRWVRLKPRADHLFSGRVRVPAGKAVAICAQFPGGDGGWTTLVEY